VRAIGRVTFAEIVRDKVLYNAILCAVLLIGAGFLASRLAFARPERIVLDFGLSACTLSLLMISLVFGANLIPRELERRTALLALSKPITRFEFLLGKFAGLSAVIGANAVILSATYLITLLLSGGSVTGVLVVALVFALLQGLMAGAVAIFFSTFSTASLSVVVSLGVYLIGINVSQLHFVASRMRSPVIGRMIDAFALVFPNFEIFGLGTKVTYGLPVPPAYCAAAVAYGLVFVAIVIAGAGFILGRKEI